MLEKLKERVWEANLSLSKNNLIKLTWGNVSEIDEDRRYVAIKPSGVSYKDLKVSDIVIVDLDGKVIEGALNPSSDTPTHLELYRRFPKIGGITHTHSHYATVFAQCGMNIPILGTTHADTFYGDIPCTRKLTRKEILGNYELETGKVIAELFTEQTISKMSAALVYSHGPFAWGKDSKTSVENAIILEEIAKMCWHSLMLAKTDINIQQELVDKHFFRKHGKGAYYGQKGELK